MPSPRLLRLVLLLSALILAAWTGGTAPDRPTVRQPPEHARHALPSADVVIDAGHGGIDGGTHYGPILEKDINLAIARKLYMILRSRGVNAVLNRTGDYALSDDNRWHRASRHNRDLSQRGTLSDQIEARLFVSIHVNWSPGDKEAGPLVIYQPEGGSALLASLIQERLNELRQTRKRPRASGHYYLLRRVDIPCVIVETGFLSNAADRAWLISPRGQSRAASAIAQGLLLYRAVAS